MLQRRLANSPLLFPNSLHQSVSMLWQKLPESEVRIEHSLDVVAPKVPISTIRAWPLLVFHVRKICALDKVTYCHRKSRLGAPFTGSRSEAGFPMTEIGRA